MAYGTRRAALQRRTTFGGGYGGGGVSPFSLPYPPGGGQGQALQLNTSDIARAGTAAKLELYKINSDWQHRSLEGQRQFIMDQARNRIEQQKINQDEEFRWRKLDADKTDAAARLAQQEFSNTMALGHFGLSQGTAAAAAEVREKNKAVKRWTEIGKLMEGGLLEADATKTVDEQMPELKPSAPSGSGGQLPAPPTVQATPEGYRPTPQTGGTQLPAPPQQVPPQAGPTLSGWADPNTPEGVQSASMAGTLNARATGIQGMQAVGAGPQAAEQAAMKQEAALQGKGPALGPYERTVAAQAEAAIAANAPIPGPAPQPPPRRKGWKEELPDDETRGLEGIQETVSAPVAWLLDKLDWRGPRSASGAKGAPAPGGTEAKPNPLAPPTAAPQATPGTLPPSPQETPTPRERAAQSKREKGNLPKQDAALAKDLERFKKGLLGFPEKGDEGYEQYMKAKKRYDAVHSKYMKSIDLPEEPAEDAATTQTLTAPPEAKQQAAFQALRKDPNLSQYSDAQLWGAIRGQ